MLRLESKSVREHGISLLIILIFNFCFLFFPLINLLSYESSILNAIIFYFIFSWKFSGLRNNIKSLIYFSIIAYLIPFIVLGSNTFFFTGCSICSGVKFYLLIMLPTTVFAIFTGLSIKNIKKKWQKLIIIFVIFIFALIDIPFELYSNPQMYFFNTIIGYFPGTIYDQFIQITPKFVAFRIGLVIFSIMFMIPARKNKTKFNFLLPLLFLILFYSVKSMVGLTTSQEKMMEELGGMKSTNNSIIIFDRSIDSSKVDLLAKKQDFYIEKLKNSLQIDSFPKITTILFKNNRQKRELFGAPGADVAKPWLHQIYISFPNYDQTLKHELVHVLLANYASPPLYLGADLDPAIIEGFASGLTDNFQNFSIDFAAKLIAENLDSLYFENFSDLNFFNVNSYISYNYTGSFVKYLYGNLSFDQFISIYSSGNEVLSEIDVNSLRKNYAKYIEALPEINAPELFNYYFGSAPTFRKRCLRSNAEKIFYALDNFREKNYPEAYSLFRESYLQSGEFYSLSGMIEALNAQKHFDSAFQILTGEIGRFKSSRSQIPAEYLLLKEAILNNQLKMADSLLNDLKILSLPENYKFSLKIVEKSLSDSINIFSGDTTA
ncbi:MAG: hypothetical protein D6830_07785, partial [Ignavibacteria bacterium]